MSCFIFIPVGAETGAYLFYLIFVLLACLILYILNRYINK